MSQTFDGTIILADHEPGDATRYELGLVDAPAKSYLLFTWTNAPGGGKSMRVPRGRAPSVDYVASKMGIRERDAEVMCRWLKSFGIDAEVR